jgi:hypothetical protein
MIASGETPRTIFFATSAFSSVRAVMKSFAPSFAKLIAGTHGLGRRRSGVEGTRGLVIHADHPGAAPVKELGAEGVLNKVNFL